MQKLKRLARRHWTSRLCSGGGSWIQGHLNYAQRFKDSYDSYAVRSQSSSRVPTVQAYKLSLSQNNNNNNNYNVVVHYQQRHREAQLDELFVLCPCFSSKLAFRLKLSSASIIWLGGVAEITRCKWSRPRSAAPVARHHW